MLGLLAIAIDLYRFSVTTTLLIAKRTTATGHTYFVKGLGYREFLPSAFRMAGATCVPNSSMERITCR